ncbi:M56 family metallopeptidase [Nocardia neocaledoniensis]|uniref:M56 family metallopeptidase n=1 Tax=Nocardia neocaledoniensis TaxID=236511 RepID=UPI0024548346|nr:M56 family metallopeptidase [Nocardia neocaledoniensis]
MILLIALLAAGAILAMGTPTVLRRIDFGGAPVVGIVAWMGAVSATIAVGVLALTALAWPGEPPGNSSVGAVARSLAEIEPTVVTWAADLILPAAMAGALLPIGLVTRVAVIHARKWSAHRRRHTELLALLGRVDPAGTGLVWLDHPVPLAYSVSGHGGYVVVTDGLARCLTETQWRAVLAHEHAHLRARHHHILGVCQVLAGAFPRIPLFAAAPSALTTLVELAADRAAAIRTDPHSLGSALRTVAGHGARMSIATVEPTPDSLAERLACLGAAPESRSAARRRAAGALVGTVLLVPITAALAVGLGSVAASFAVI